MPRRSTSGFHRLGRYCLHQARSQTLGIRRVVRGVSCILPRTGCEAILHMNDSFSELTYFPVWPLRIDSNGVQCNCLAGSSPETLRDTMIPLVVRRGGPNRYRRARCGGGVKRDGGLSFLTRCLAGTPDKASDRPHFH